MVFCGLPKVIPIVGGGGVKAFWGDASAGWLEFGWI
jgi:hypothetical protein